MSNIAKETFLKMKGWEQLQAGDGMLLSCVGCNNHFMKLGKNYVAGGYKTTYLHMKIAPHWPMCEGHAFRATEPGWSQSSHFNGSSW